MQRSQPTFNPLECTKTICLHFSSSLKSTPLSATPSPPPPQISTRRPNWTLSSTDAILDATMFESPLFVPLCPETERHVITSVASTTTPLTTGSNLNYHEWQLHSHDAAVHGAVGGGRKPPRAQFPSEIAKGVKKIEKKTRAVGRANCHRIGVIGAVELTRKLI